MWHYAKHFSYLLSLLLLTVVSATSTAQDTLRFRAPEEPGALTDYVTQVLEEAYAELGIQMEYLDMPRARSIVEANAGRIDGELGRRPNLADEYPNLIRVEFPLFSYALVIVADRRQCGLCELQDLQNFGYVNGMIGVEELLREQPFGGATVTAVDLTQLIHMYRANRVQAVVMNDFEARQLRLDEDRHSIIVPVQHNIGYHFLHNKHEVLAQQLAITLHRMHDSGRITAIMRAHGVENSRQQQFHELPQFGEIRATAGHWRSLTNLDGSGTYWELIRRIFAPVSSELELSANTYQRAILGLTEARFDILIGTYAQQQPANAVVSRLHFDYDRPLYAFAHEQTQLERLLQGDFDDLICHVAGYGYDEFLPDGLNYYYTSNTLDCFAMLDLKRMGAVVAYRENAPDWTSSPYQSVRLHDSLPIHVAFQDTPRGRQLRDWFDYRLRELIRSGEIAEFYGQGDLVRSHYERNLPPIRPQRSLVGAMPQN